MLAALPPLLRQQMRLEVYQMYTAAALMHTVNNTQRVAGGVSISKAYTDLIDDKKWRQRQDTRTGEEIAADIIKRAGLEVVNNSESI